MSYVSELSRHYSDTRARLMSPGITPAPRIEPERRPYAPKLWQPPKPEPERIVVRDFILVSSNLLDFAGISPASRIEGIVREVCVARGVRRDELFSRRKEDRIAHARHEVCWRARNETSLSYPQIGKLLGRDHTTVMNGYKTHAARLAAAAVLA